MEQQVSGPQIFGRLVSKPGKLIDFCHRYGEHHAANQSNSKTNPTQVLNLSRDLEAGSTVVTGSSEVGFLTCDCQPQRRVQRKRLFWASLELFRDIRTVAYHSPSCPLASFTTTVDQFWGIKHITVSQALGRAIQLSFYLAFGSRGLSMGPTINFQARVNEKHSPAFLCVHMMSALVREVNMSTYKTDGISHKTDGISQEAIGQIKNFLRAVILKIGILFDHRKALPSDIDTKNQTLIYPVLKTVCSTTSSNILQSRIQTNRMTVCRLWVLHILVTIL